MQLSRKIVDEIRLGDMIEKTNVFKLDSPTEYPMITLNDIIKADKHFLTNKKAEVNGLFIQKDDGLAYQIKGINVGTNGLTIDLPSPNGVLTISTEQYTIKLFIAPSIE